MATTVRDSTPSDATPDTVAALVTLVNESYGVETGNTGPAFKCTLRFHTPDDVAGFTKGLSAGEVLLAVLPDGSVGGVLQWEIVNDPVTGEKQIYFGPLAVAQSAQGRGVSTALLHACYAKGREKGATAVTISVANWRTELWWRDEMGEDPGLDGVVPPHVPPPPREAGAAPPFYARHGFRFVRNEPFWWVERLTRPTYFAILQRTI